MLTNKTLADIKRFGPVGILLVFDAVETKERMGALAFTIRITIGNKVVCYMTKHAKRQAPAIDLDLGAMELKAAVAAQRFLERTDPTEKDVRIKLSLATARDLVIRLFSDPRYAFSASINSESIPPADWLRTMILLYNHIKEERSMIYSRSRKMGLSGRSLAGQLQKMKRNMLEDQISRYVGPLGGEDLEAKELDRLAAEAEMEKELDLNRITKGLREVIRKRSPEEIAAAQQKLKEWGINLKTHPKSREEEIKAEEEEFARLTKLFSIHRGEEPVQAPPTSEAPAGAGTQPVQTPAKNTSSEETEPQTPKKPPLEKLLGKWAPSESPTDSSQKTKDGEK